MNMVVLYFVLLCVKASYLPVVYLHGMGSDRYSGNTLKSTIQSHHHGTRFVSIPMFESADSFVGLNIQVKSLLVYLKKLVITDRDFHHGFNLVCHSQGGLLCRSVIQRWDGHKVRSFVSLAGPQMGVYSEEYLDNYVKFFDDHNILANVTIKQAWKVFSPKIVQETFNIANMWHDANHEDAFVSDNLFLPKQNNLIPHPDMDDYKRNFVNLDQAVFLIGDMGSKDYDGGVGPWQSGVWGFYGTNGDDSWAMKDVTQHRIWTEDLIGLQALDTLGKLHLQAVPNIDHGAWIHDRWVIEKYILPWLN